MLYVVYTVRDYEDDKYIRLISARIAESDEKDLYFRWLEGRR